jgi:type I restriction enzyme S subunit
MVLVRDVSDLVTKGTTPTSIGRRFTSSGVKFLKVETFAADGSFISGREAFIDSATHDLLRRSQLVQGDILFSIAGALGRSTLVEQAWLPANTNQAFAIIRPSTRRRSIHPRYLLWQLRGPAIARRISEINVQAAQSNLSLEQVRDFEIPIVSSPEQEAIVAALDDADDLITTLQRLIAKKQAIKQGMMQELLTGGRRLSGFSGAWVEKPAGEIGAFKGGSGFPVRHQGAVSGKYPFYKVSDMNLAGNERVMRAANNYISQLQRKQIGAVVMPRHAIVFAKVGAAIFQERKRLLDQPSCIDNNMAALILDSEAADPHFVRYALTNFSMGTLVATTALPSLNAGQLRSIPLSLPPTVDEQRAIASALLDVDVELDALGRRVTKARAIKQGMMQQLLTGSTRLRVEAAV